MRALPLLALALCLTGCDIEDFDGRRVEEDFHNSSPMNAGGRVTVETFNGTVEVIGWEKNEVSIDGTKYASTKALLSMIKVDVVANAGEVRVRVVRPDFRRGNMGTRMTVHVPRKVTLDKIASSNGGIKASDVEGPVRLKTSNGTVRASNIVGSLDVLTSNGAIEVREIRGENVLHTSNGKVTADAVRGSLDVSTSNGAIEAHLVEPQAGHRQRFETHNGGITLWLPSNTNAELSASTTNSSVSTDFDLLMKGGEVSKRHLGGKLGTGGASIDLTTSNGRIRVLKL